MKGYSYQGDLEKTARALGKDLNVSWKKCNEICYTIKNMKLNKAIEYLEKVMQRKEFVPYRRYNTGIAHRKGGIPGGYPVKAAKIIKKILENAKNNAEQKGLDTEKLKIIHATAYKTITLERVKPKTGSRGGFSYTSGMMHNIELANVEIVVKEV